MKNPGQQNERRAKAQERLSLRESTLVQDVVRTGDISLHAAYPHAMRALEEIRTGKPMIDTATHLQEAAHDFFQPKTYGPVANYLAEASQTISRPRFEAAPVIQQAAPQPAAAPIEFTPELRSDPFANVPAQTEAALDYPAPVAATDMPEQAGYMRQLDSELDAGTAGGRAHMDMIDLYQADSANAGYLDDGADAARRMVDAAYAHSDKTLEQVG